MQNTATIALLPAENLRGCRVGHRPGRTVSALWICFATAPCGVRAALLTRTLFFAISHGHSSSIGPQNSDDSESSVFFDQFLDVILRCPLRDHALAFVEGVDGASATREKPFQMTRGPFPH